MELKTKSWYVWLWEYTYAEDLPNNLCPFFWKLIVAMLLFIPNVIFRIPVTISNLFMTWPIKRGDNRTGNGIVMWLLFNLFIVTIIFNYHLFLWLIGDDSAEISWVVGGIFMDFVILLILIRHLWENTLIADRLAYKASNNIIVTMTKAWYKNHCPKINWKDKE